MAFILFDGLRFRRSLVLNNIETALPALTPAERAKVARTSIANFILTAFEFLRGVRIDIASETTLHQTEIIHAALAQHKGVYIICCHLGSWEAMGARITRSVAPAHVLVKKVGGSSLNRFVSELRERYGFMAVSRKGKGDGLRAIVKALKRHEIIGFVMDQARPGEPRLPFFGKPAKTNTSLAAIWLRHPAPIVPAYARRTAVGRHEIEFLPALELTTTGNDEQDILRLSEQFNRTVEDLIRLNPTQYFWLHNRWK